MLRKIKSATPLRAPQELLLSKLRLLAVTSMSNSA